MADTGQEFLRFQVPEKMTGGSRCNTGLVRAQETQWPMPGTHYNKGTDKEAVNYHYDVLEAKVLLDRSLVASIASKFTEDNGEDASGRKNMSGEGAKQDCERKAFKRVAEKLKKAFPRLPVTILADSLYASGPVMDICRGYDWEFIIRYKAGSIPGIAEEYGNIPEKGRQGVQSSSMTLIMTEKGKHAAVLGR